MMNAAELGSNAMTENIDISLTPAEVVAIIRARDRRRKCCPWLGSNIGHSGSNGQRGLY
jgi:hypothetical protein